jgi:hypothetical protein
MAGQRPVALLHYLDNTKANCIFAPVFTYAIA